MKALDVKEVKEGTHIWEIKDAVDRDLCAAVVDYFERHCKKYSGQVGEGVVNEEVKHSTDSSLPAHSLFDLMLAEIYSEAVEAFRETVPGLHWTLNHPSIDMTLFQVQSYAPGRGQYTWHVDSQDPESSRRLMALILYLNDVSEGGETEFKHQKVKVKPEAGKIVCFPPFWTHEHRGLPSSEQKYIITNFVGFNLKNTD